MEKKPLSGRIFWIEYTFQMAKEDTYTPKEDETSFTSALISNVRIDDFSIEFNTLKGEEIDYTVSMPYDKYSKSKYIGEYHHKSRTDDLGEVTCEKFENEEAFLLKGIWDDKNGKYGTYTWFARIEKPE